MSKISDLVEEIAAPIVEQNGCALWDVEYLKEAGSWYLRVYIDKPEGISIQDCENISRALDPVLDEKDFIPNSYVFEVCSAGADRILKRPRDFEAFIGHKVDVSLYRPFEGAKSFTGVLQAYAPEELTIAVSEKEYRFPHDLVAQVRLHVDF